MKRLTKFLILPIFFISCHPDTVVKKDGENDSVRTTTVDTNQAPIKADTLTKVSVINIKDYEVPEKEAQEMISWYSKCSPAMRHDKTTITVMDNVEDAIRKANPKAEIEWVNARFKDKDDETLYCKTIGGDSTGGKCAVRNYKGKFIKVKGGPKPLYYLAIHLCPPPRNGCDTSHVYNNVNNHIPPTEKK